MTLSRLAASVPAASARLAASVRLAASTPAASTRLAASVPAASRSAGSGPATAAGAAGPGSPAGFPVTDAIGIAVLVLVVILVLVMLAWWLGRPSGWTPGLPGWTSRTRRIQEAAAEDVAAVRQDARRVSPDAPGNYPDEL